MQVGQIIRRKGGDIAGVAPETPITDVAAMLKDRGIGAAVVLGPDGKLAGIVSERDIVHALADHDGAVADLTAADLMTTDVQTCKPAHEINDVMRVMTQKRFRHLPVMDGGTLIGVISIGDAVKSRIEELENERNALESFVHQ
jgi:CBS domain-containing protein